MAQKKKRTSGNPVPKTERELLAARVFNRVQQGTLLVRDLENHIEPLGDSLLTLEQWCYLRGSVMVDIAVLAQLTGKPSPIELIIKSEQQRVLVDF